MLMSVITCPPTSRGKTWQEGKVCIATEKAAGPAGQRELRELRELHC